MQTIHKLAGFTLNEALDLARPDACHSAMYILDRCGSWETVMGHDYFVSWAMWFASGFRPFDEEDDVVFTRLAANPQMKEVIALADAYMAAMDAVRSMAVEHVDFILAAWLEARDAFAAGLLALPSTTFEEAGE